jgi:hypothetical protein
MTLEEALRITIRATGLAVSGVLAWRWRWWMPAVT